MAVNLPTQTGLNLGFVEHGMDAKPDKICIRSVIKRAACESISLVTAYLRYIRYHELTKEAITNERTSNKTMNIKQ